MTVTIYSRLYDAIVSAEMDELAKKAKIEFVKHCQKIGLPYLDNKDKQTLYAMYGELV